MDLLLPCPNLARQRGMQSPKTPLQHLFFGRALPGKTNLKKAFVLILLSLSLLYALQKGAVFLSHHNQIKSLRVMTYSSFAGVFGPGEELKKKFMAVCDCQVKWIKIPDSTLFKQRLLLKKDHFKVDVVMGFDQILARDLLPSRDFSEKNQNTDLVWEDVLVSKQIFNPSAGRFLSSHFIPYNWSPMTFISNKPVQKMMSLKDLLKPQYRGKISLPSPAHSTVGLQFFYWVGFVKSEGAKSFLNRIRPQLYGLAPSWSTSYALFQRGHVDLSFSYFSSLLYHRQQNQKDFYGVFFKEGHPFQVEMAGILKSSKEKALARQFIHFLLTPEVQHLLMQKNYMFPAIRKQRLLAETKKNQETFWNQNQPSDFLTSPPSDKRGFENLKLISYHQLKDFLKDKTPWLHLWQ